MNINFNLTICIATLIILLWIAYKDYKQRIIPDLTVVCILLLSCIYYYLNHYNIKDFIFFMFFASVPILLISSLVDSLSGAGMKITDYLAILASIIAGVLVPFNLKEKYITACFVLIIFIIIEYFISRKKDENEEYAGSLGGGDIKLVAVLGPILRDNMIGFLFVTFLLAFIFMKIKKESNIYLAPFMFLAFLLFVLYL